MSPEAVLTRLRAQNAERQRRYRERQKAAKADDYRVSNAERQRRYRERKAAAEAAPAQRILAQVTVRPGVTASELFLQLNISRDAFIGAVASLTRDGRVIYAPDDRLFLSGKR